MAGIFPCGQGKWREYFLHGQGNWGEYFHVDKKTGRNFPT
jgi:hypothetical protein